MKSYLTSLVTREAWEMQIKTSPTKIAKTKKNNQEHSFHHTYNKAQECGATELFATVQTQGYNHFRGREKKLAVSATQRSMPT